MGNQHRSKDDQHYLLVHMHLCHMRPHYTSQNYKMVKCLQSQWPLAYSLTVQIAWLNTVHVHCRSFPPVLPLWEGNSESPGQDYHCTLSCTVPHGMSRVNVYLYMYMYSVRMYMYMPAIRLHVFTALHAWNTMCVNRRLLIRHVYIYKYR